MPTDSGQVRRFRRLLGWTILATFFLMVQGAVVRVSESGLGCGPAGSGTYGWPLCEGGLLPPATAESLIEFAHRAIAGVVAIMIAVLVWRAFKGLRDRKWIVRGSVAAGVLVVIQALLGGLTVEEGLMDELVAAHLGLATLLIGLLILMYRGVESRPEPGPPGRGLTALRTSVVASAVLVFAAVVAGGYVAGTERFGTPESPIYGAHMACGAEFPTCLGGQLLPFGIDRLVDIHLTHRVLGILATIAVLAMVGIALAQRRHWAFPAAGILIIGQVLLGAVNVWEGIHAGLIVAHLALGVIVWSVLVYAGGSLMPLSRSPGPEPSAPAEGEAAPVEVAVP